MSLKTEKKKKVYRVHLAIRDYRWAIPCDRHALIKGRLFPLSFPPRNQRQSDYTHMLWVTRYQLHAIGLPRSQNDPLHCLGVLTVLYLPDTYNSPNPLPHCPLES